MAQLNDMYIGDEEAGELLSLNERLENTTDVLDEQYVEERIRVLVHELLYND